jgi:hypothetical protein
MSAYGPAEQPPPPATSTALPAEDPRDRRRIITSNCATFGAGAAVCALTFLLIGDALDGGHVAQRIAADAALLLLLLAYITLSTRSAVRQLVEMFVALVRTAITDTIRREVREQLKEPGDKIAAELATIRERMGDESTVPLAGTVYASASVQVDGVLNILRAQVDQRVDEAIGAKVQEFGNQRWYAGYAAGREDGSGGSVVALQPRNGHRS